GPKRRQDVVDAVDRRKDFFAFPLCVNDFLAGFALVQQAPVLRKFECTATTTYFLYRLWITLRAIVISKLANTGAMCSKPELLLAMWFGVRGIAKLKGSKLPPDKALRCIANNVLNSKPSLDWAAVIQKLMVVPDVVFFLCDLDMVLVENLETLIADQLHGMKQLAAIEYEIGVAAGLSWVAVVCKATRNTTTAQSDPSPCDYAIPPPPPRRPVLEWLGLSSNLRTTTSSGQSKRVQVPNVDKCCRRIQNAFKAANTPTSDSTRTLSLETSLRFNVRRLQELVLMATENSIAMSDVEAEHHLEHFSKDQLERIACSDMLRWFKQWAADQNRETPPKWQIAATSCVDICRSASSWWRRLVSSVRDTFGKGGQPSVEQRHDVIDLEAPQESNYSFLVHIEAPRSTPFQGRPDEATTTTSTNDHAAATLSCRFEFKEKAADDKHPSTAPNSVDILDQMQLDDDEVLETGFPMAFTMEFLLWKSVTVSIVYGYREHATKSMPQTASDKYYLRMTFLMRHSVFGDVESALHDKLQNLFQTLHFELTLENSFDELLAYSTSAAAAMMTSLWPPHAPDHHENDTTSLVQHLFQRMDSNGDGELSLDEVNAFQQSMDQSVLGTAAQYQHLIASNNLPHNPQTGNLTAPGLDAYFEKFGGLQSAYQSLHIGCLNDILHGTLSVATSLNRHALSKLQTFFASCSPLHNIAAKWGLFTALQLTDVSMELTFPNAMACLRSAGMARSGRG
ncbi:hypothetical protein AaE_012015, partial [Aphanomyces astaci]